MGSNFGACGNAFKKHPCSLCCLLQQRASLFLIQQLQQRFIRNNKRETTFLNFETCQKHKLFTIGELHSCIAAQIVFLL